MFDWFKKKEKEPMLLTEEEILQKVEENKKENYHSSFFPDSQLSQETRMRLENQGFSVRVLDSYFEIFWK